jgi:hypothetical protein
VEFLIVLVVLAVVVFVVTAPLRRPATDAGGLQADVARESEDAELAELEAARDAKYREIRDAELDHSTGKLSDADFEAINSGLRAEAVEILREIDLVRPPQPDAAARSDDEDGAG